MRHIIIAALAAIALSGCASTPGNGLSPEGQLALETSVRIAVRHAVADSPRSAEKARNIRSIVVRLQAITSADTYNCIWDGLADAAQGLACAWQRLCPSSCRRRLAP